MRRRLTIEIYKGKGKQQWRWRLLAHNFKIIADSAEAYANRSNALRAAKRIKDILWTGCDVMDRDPVDGIWRKLA